MYHGNEQQEPQMLWLYKKSNAMAERLNGKIQEIKLNAKGYRFFENFRAAILFFHGKLCLYP